MPAAVLTQANALRWLGSAQYELAGLLLILNGQTQYAATLTIEQARCTRPYQLHPWAALPGCTPQAAPLGWTCSPPWRCRPTAA